MADIILEKPPAGQHITVPAHAGARFVIKFDTSEATPKKDGANFIFTFEDGSSITITNFYGIPRSSLAPQGNDFAESLQNVSLPEILEKIGIDHNNAPAHHYENRLLLAEKSNHRLYDYDAAESSVVTQQHLFITFS